MDEFETVVFVPFSVVWQYRKAYILLYIHDIIDLWSYDTDIILGYAFLSISFPLHPSKNPYCAQNNNFHTHSGNRI